MVRLAAGIFIAMATAAWAGDALACAPCSTGDPTLTVTGAEKPYEGRLRMSAQFQHRTESTGVAGVDEITSAEQRLELSAAYAVTDWLFLVTKVPIVRRRAQYVNLARDEVLSLGDVEVRAKAFIYQDRSLAARHLVAVTGGLGVPTAPVFTNDAGRDLPLEAQPGTASFNAFAGVSYAHFTPPFSLYFSANLGLPLAHQSNTHIGAFGLFTAAAQYQPHDIIALRTSIDARLDEPLEEDGVRDPHSGGVATFVSPEVVFMPVEDLLLRLVVQLPALRWVGGTTSEGVSVLAGAAFDF